jgi:hypothetical protein
MLANPLHQQRQTHGRDCQIQLHVSGSVTTACHERQMIDDRPPVALHQACRDKFVHEVARGAGCSILIVRHQDKPGTYVLWSTEGKM